MFAIKVRNKIVIFCVYSRFGEKTIYSLLPISIYSQCVCVWERRGRIADCVWACIESFDIIQYQCDWYTVVYTVKKILCMKACCFVDFEFVSVTWALCILKGFTFVFENARLIYSFKLKRNLEGKRCVGSISYSNYQEENKAGYTVFIYHTWLCTVQED